MPECGGNGTFIRGTRLFLFQIPYRLQSVQTTPPTNPSTAARKIDLDPMIALALPTPDRVTPNRERRRGAASGTTKRTTIHRIAVAIAVRTPTPAAVT